MPTTPYAQLTVSVNGGAPQTGGITIAAGDTIQFSAVSKAGWTKGRWEMIAPPGVTVPAGWTDAGSGKFTYDGTTGDPPIWTAPAITLWGKWMPTLVVNDTIKFGAAGNVDMTDTATALRMLSLSGADDIGVGETTQFSTLRAWVDGYQTGIRHTGSGSTGRQTKSIAGTGTTTLSTTESAANILELTGALTGDRIVDFIVTDGRETTIVNNTTGAGYVFARAASGSTKLHVPRNRPLRVYCGTAELAAAGKPSRVFMGGSAQPYYWWRGDEASGTTLANTGTGGANTLTGAGGIRLGSDRPSRIRGGTETTPLITVAATGYAVGVAGSNPGGNSWMFGCWAYPVSGNGVIMCYGTDHLVQLSGGVVAASIATSGGAKTVAFTEAYRLGEWMHVMVGSSAGTSVKVYWNGMEYSAGGFAVTVTWDVLKAFTMGTANAMGVGSRWDDLRVYNYFDASLPSQIWAYGIGAP